MLFLQPLFSLLTTDSQLDFNFYNCSPFFPLILSTAFLNYTLISFNNNEALTSNAYLCSLTLDLSSYKTLLVLTKEISLAYVQNVDSKIFSLAQ